MKLIVGLGNPGPEYAATRHNAGFLAVRAFHDRHAGAFGGWSAKFGAEISEGRLAGSKISLILPQTYMNLSGGPVAEAMKFWKVAPSDVIVVHDELDLPLGTLRVKVGGSAGGHNGLKSIIERLGAEDFIRIRLGIGTGERSRIPAERFVLQRWPAAESGVMAEVRRRVLTVIEDIVKDGPERAMSRHHAPETK
jgi:PTH1 family peptidyl-tRNA hydrolase